MKLEPNMYVPSLSWRQAEYQALLELAPGAKPLVVPLVTIPQIEFDFEIWAPKKSAHEHLFPFPRRFKAKWGKRPCWIDIDPSLREETMNDGTSAHRYVFEGIRQNDAQAIPVLSLEMPKSYMNEVSITVAEDQHGIGLRVRLEDLMSPDFNERVSDVLTGTQTPRSESDLLIDLFAPNYSPYGGFANALIFAIKSIDNLTDFRNIVIIGTAMPESLAEIARPGGSIPRHDWMFYKTLKNSIPSNIPTPLYGDYTIVHPAFTAQDMRKIKPAGKIVYTVDDAWMVRKGGAFRDSREQMHEHCQFIVSSGEYRGSGYSWGDFYIQECADEREGPSTLGQWKKVGINHHIKVVLDDLSILCEAA